MSGSTGLCPLCREPNRISQLYCERCGYRLPWADELEGLAPDAKVKPASDSAIDRFLKDAGMLPARTLTCRYCHQPIEVDTKKCTHCGEWLTASPGLMAVDPWRDDFDPRDLEHTSLKATGCTAPTFIAALMAILLRYWL